jgi:aspartokinase/homoserine dehydrogenase 2
VAGVYSADPRKVKDACLLPLLRLDEASELARLAAPVLHARTLQPVSGSDIDLQLRCSYTRIKAPRALSACWRPVPGRVLSPATTTSA